MRRSHRGRPGFCVLPNNKRWGAPALQLLISGADSSERCAIVHRSALFVLPGEGERRLVGCDEVQENELVELGNSSLTKVSLRFRSLSNRVTTLARAGNQYRKREVLLAPSTFGRAYPQRADNDRINRIFKLKGDHGTLPVHPSPI